MVTVTGENMDAAAQPIIIVTVVVVRFNSTNNHTTREYTESSEVLTCDAVYQEQKPVNTCVHSYS